MNKQDQELQDYFILDRRHTSWVIAGLLALVTFAFVVGFLWGRRAQMREETERIADEAFVDKARSAVLQGGQQETMLPPQVPEKVEEENAPTTETESNVLWVAQLAGFGQLGRAQAVVSRLKKLGIQTRVETRKGKKGKRRVVWYQVVTEPHADRQELELLVQRLKTIERLPTTPKIVTA